MKINRFYGYICFCDEAVQKNMGNLLKVKSLTTQQYMSKKYVTKSFQNKIMPYLTTFDDAEKKQFYDDADLAVQELVSFGKDHKEVLWIMQSIGLYLYGNSGKNFYVDYQKISLSDDCVLWTMQPPGGGCVHLFQTPEGKLLIDAGYGVNYDDWVRTLSTFSLGDFSDVKHVLCTHGDADHVGMTGLLPVPPFVHPITQDLLDHGSRTFASTNNLLLLERVYTTTVNIFSQLAFPKEYILSKTEPLRMRGIFPVIDEISFASLNFEVWESLGGHLAGQLFFYEPEEGLLFTSDAILNFATLTPWRLRYGSIPDYLINSVNIDSALARHERGELMKLAVELDTELRKKGKRIRLCCGHGAVSAIDVHGDLEVIDPVVHYSPRKFTEGLHDLIAKISWFVKRRLI